MSQQDKFELIENADADAYQRLSARTLIEKPLRPLTDDEVMLIWNGMKLAGEAGELADYIAKGVFHEHGIDDDKLIKELGDVLWYVAAIASKKGWRLSRIMCENVDKLERRYPEGFSTDASINRTA